MVYCVNIPQGSLKTIKSKKCFAEERYTTTTLVCAWTGGVYPMVSDVNLTSNLLRVWYHWSSLLLYNTLHVNSAKTTRVTKKKSVKFPIGRGEKWYSLSRTHAREGSHRHHKNTRSKISASTRDPFCDAYIPEENISPYEWEVIYDPHHTLDEPLAWPACKLYSFVQWECWVKWRAQFPCKLASAEPRANWKRREITAQT